MTKQQPENVKNIIISEIIFNDGAIVTIGIAKRRTHNNRPSPAEKWI